MDVNVNGLNPLSLLYLTGRMSPIIFGCFFILSSVINGDLKGLFLLIGLLITITIAKVVGNIGSVFVNKRIANKYDTCYLISIGSNGPYSNIPLGITSLTYMLIYLIYPIIKYDALKNNEKLVVLKTDLNNWRITLLTFCLIINIIWLTTLKCANPFAIVAGILIAIIVALLYAYVVDVIGSNKLYLTEDTPVKEYCTISGTIVSCN